MPAKLLLTDAEAVAALFERAAAVMRECRWRRGSAVRLPASGRLLVTGDLHDNPVHLDKIVRAARLDASPDHHVILHEIIHGERLVNGVDLSHRMLARVASLIIEHPDQAHALLANHELCQMTGKGVSKGAGNSVELFLDGLDYVFGEHADMVAGAIGEFIRAMPLALLSESGLLCAHSLPAPRAMSTFDLDVLDRELVNEDYLAPHGAAYQMVWGRQHAREQIEALASRWNVKLFCLGHEMVETGIEARGENVLLLNSDHEAGAVVSVDLAQVPSAPEALLHGVPLRSLPA